MPLIPNALERLILIGLNQQPALLLDYFATLGFRAAIAAVRLGVFDALDSGPGTADELATRLGSDRRGTTALNRKDVRRTTPGRIRPLIIPRRADRPSAL